jgi:hypothetical protein
MLIRKTTYGTMVLKLLKISQGFEITAAANFD